MQRTLGGFGSVFVEAHDSSQFGQAVLGGADLGPLRADMNHIDPGAHTPAGGLFADPSELAGLSWLSQESKSPAPCISPAPPSRWVAPIREESEAPPFSSLANLLESVAQLTAETDRERSPSPPALASCSPPALDSRSLRLDGCRSSSPPLAIGNDIMPSLEGCSPSPYNSSSPFPIDEGRCSGAVNSSRPASNTTTTHTGTIPSSEGSMANSCDLSDGHTGLIYTGEDRTPIAPPPQLLFDQEGMLCAKRRLLMTSVAPPPSLLFDQVAQWERKRKNAMQVQRFTTSKGMLAPLAWKPKVRRWARQVGLEGLRTRTLLSTK
eukprot:Sspe_Gene.11752::Locus_3985_Transcript_1_1_Confidence_1.000_Length_1158::g.11752::m.11752